MTALAFPTSHSATGPLDHSATSSGGHLATSASEGWISLDEARRRSGLDMTHLQRMCREKWLLTGLARLDSGQGVPLWTVAVAAHPRFVAAAGPEDALLDIPARKREEAWHRRDIVLAWQRAVEGSAQPKDQVTAAYLLALEEKISRRTLYLWDRRYRELGIRGLVDQRGVYGQTPCDDPFFDEVRRLWLDYKHRHDATVCYQMAMAKAVQHGWEVASYRSICRRLEAIPRAVVVKMRHGPEAYTNEAESYIQRDYTSVQVNELWVGDEHTLDVAVEVIDARTGEVKPQRVYLTGWMDVRTRKMVGYSIHAHHANADTILSVFRDAALKYGLPSHVIIDNGKDYGAKSIHGDTKSARRLVNRGLLVPPERADGVFPRLNIGVTFCQVRHGQSKGIERAFGTICRRFSRFFQTWTGNLPTAKPHGLAERIKSGKAPTLDELAELFAWWLENDYHAMPHQGDGMSGLSPNEVWKSHPYTKRTAGQELMNLLLCPRVGPVKVHQNGVTWKTIQYGQHSRELFALLGKEVWLRVDGPLQVTVWDAQDRLVCIAPCNSKLPVLADKQMVRDALAQKRQRNRLAKEYHAMRPRLHEPIEQQLAAMVAGKRAALERSGRELPPPDAAPPSPDRISPVHSGLESQIKMLQRLRELPVAVGAESLSMAEVSRRLGQDRTVNQGEESGNAFARLALALHAEDTQ